MTPPNPLGNATVLIVEDDDGQARLTERTLRGQGFLIRREATGRGCLAALSEPGDVVVLLDLGLPDLPGVRVLEEIVTHSEETAVIVVTGVDDLTVAMDAIRRGAWDYVVKRPDLSHLAELPCVIRRNRERQRLVRERNLFRSMLSHDIRNPLNVIFNYADMIGEEPQLSAGARMLLQRIKDNAATTLALVANFVEVGRIEAGPLRLDRRPICFRSLAAEVVARQEAFALGRGVTLALQSPADLPLVPVDAAYMERALTNLLSNAIKFTPSGGSVTLRLRRDGDDVVVAVADTGSGIPRDELPHIFDKYQRGQQHGSVEGSGLGLFIVKSVIAAHGGAIAVESTVGRGSTFTVRLPLALDREAACVTA